ncbi:MAG: dockerin type I repeat-containing protein [Candidatus Altiarchaeota archaeon]|nr:dockerin type I repeat-containing protein [Candidatus Altiarchaeota archaeon]
MNKKIYMALGIALICLITSTFVMADEICGDVNCDGNVDMNDSLLLANYVSYPGQYQICSEWAAEVTGNGEINIADAMLIGNYVSYPDNPGYSLRCQEDLSVPEFNTSAVAVIVMLISPISAYFIIKSRH